MVKKKLRIIARELYNFIIHVKLHYFFIIIIHNEKSL